MTSYLRAAFILYFVLYIFSGQHLVSAGLIDTVKSAISSRVELEPKDLEHHLLESTSAGLDLVPGIFSAVTVPMQGLVKTRLT